MKLFFAPGACCMSCHIALEEAKLPFDLVYVGKKAADDVKKNFLKVNPVAAVPALELDDGIVLTQNIAILSYIADLKPEAGLLAKAGTIERAETMKWASFVAADLHKAFGPLFKIDAITQDPKAQDDIKKWCFGLIEKYLTVLENHLQNKTYLVDEKFSIADCYLYTVYQWTKAISFATDKYPALNRYSQNIDKRPSVIKVHEREEKFK